MIRRAFVLALLWAVPSYGQVTSDNVTRLDQIDRFRGFLGGVRRFYWAPGSSIPVCFEPNSEQSDQHGKDVIADAVQNSWPRAGNITFNFTGSCQQGADGVHIFLRDDRPHTLNMQLGTQLRGTRAGLILNTSFKLSGDSYCLKDVEGCIRATAVHEFGHVLGFVHEDVLPDAKKQCLGEVKGSVPDAMPITDYDPTSIMNYCSNLYAGRGMLSDLDQQGMRKAYGPPRSAT